MADAPEKNAKKAILLLGHGSKAKEANDTLRAVAEALRAREGYGCVQAAFLQIEAPDFEEGFGEIALKGFNDIIVMPYFLYMGLHVQQDLPEEIAKAKEKFPRIKVRLARSLGFHDKLVDVTVERIEELEDSGSSVAAPFAQHPIERESFRIIGAEMDESRFTALELPIVKRAIHSTADFDFQEIIRFSPGAVSAGMDAVRNGRNIITDVRMVDAGITRARLKPFGVEVFCFSSDEDVARTSDREGVTKTAASMRKAARFMEGGIVAVGNAPTALVELLRLIRGGAPAPALIVGVPVGFVGARESKEELQRSGCEYITAAGRKGGSTVAAAITNALVIQAAQAAFE
ncbi:MAG: precorrin-8X methylmutase [Deltaproteobacteria bacterium]|nr:precorrin-8X methylmutase [Deltaproteobacteria bacterium]